MITCCGRYCRMCKGKQNVVYIQFKNLNSVFFSGIYSEFGTSPTSVKLSLSRNLLFKDER